MATILKTFLFDKLPSYFKRNDTNKLVDPLTQDRGTLERYLEIFGLEVDNEVLPLIEDLLDIVDPVTADEKFLNHIAYSLGNPPDLFGDVAQYRDTLTFVMSMYKIKGTIKAYQIYFAILGYDVTLIEITPPSILYDSGYTYDDDTGDVIYDNSCPQCSEYDLSFRNRNDDCTIPVINPLDQVTLDKIETVICFNEPINAILRNLINSIKVCDDLKMCVSENVTVTSLDCALYDTALIYDNSVTYDDATPSQLFTVFNDCSGSILGIGFWIIETDFEVQ